MINEIVEKYKEEQVEKLKKWCLENPGKVMNNYDIRIMACNNIIKGKFTIEEMKTIRDASLLLWRARNGVSGWYVTATTYDEIIELCEKHSIA